MMELIITATIILSLIAIATAKTATTIAIIISAAKISAAGRNNNYYNKNCTATNNKNCRANTITTTPK